MVCLYVFALQTEHGEKEYSDDGADRGIHNGHPEAVLVCSLVVEAVYAEKDEYCAAVRERIERSGGHRDNARDVADVCPAVQEVIRQALQSQADAAGSGGHYAADSRCGEGRFPVRRQVETDYQLDDAPIAVGLRDDLTVTEQEYERSYRGDSAFKTLVDENKEIHIV